MSMLIFELYMLNVICCVLEDLQSLLYVFYRCFIVDVCLVVYEKIIVCNL